jgi:hypothetical protein
MTADTVIAPVLQGYIADDSTWMLQPWKLLGSDVKAIPIGQSMYESAYVDITKGYHWFATYYFKDTTIITGMRVSMERSGVYDSAGTNYNGVSLYSVDNTGITFVDSTRNGDGDIWLVAPGTIDSTFATGPHTLLPGEYRVGVMFSADDLDGGYTTPRLVGKTTGLTNYSRFGFTNYKKLCGYTAGKVTPEKTLIHESMSNGINAIQVVLY